MEQVVVEKGIQENSVSRMKRFEDLTFTDDFMFCTTLKENPELCRGAGGDDHRQEDQQDRQCSKAAVGGDFARRAGGEV